MARKPEVPASNRDEALFHFSQTFICIWLTVISIICAAVFGYELLPAFPSLNRNQGSYESGKGKLTFIEHLLCAKLFHDYSKYEVGISHEE